MMPQISAIGKYLDQPLLTAKLNKKVPVILGTGSAILFADSIVPMWNDCKDSTALVCAPADVLMRARVNDIYFETEEKYLSGELKHPLGYFSANTMVLNLEGMRKKYTEKNVYEANTNRWGSLRNQSEIYNILCQDNVEYIDQKYCVHTASNEYLAYQLPYAPFDDYKKLLKAQKAPVIMAYQSNDPWEMNKTEMHYAFWKVARETPFYEQYLMHSAFWDRQRDRQPKDILNTLFPVGHSMRGKLSRLFPKGSKRYKTVKKLLSVLRMK